MKEAIEKLIENIVEDFRRYEEKSPYGDEARKAERVEEFAKGLEAKEGNKYIKIVSKNFPSECVWGFVVNTDNDKKFKRGDILKAATWAAPARNKPRGNVLDGNFKSVLWTGPAYL